MTVLRNKDNKELKAEFEKWKKLLEKKLKF